MLILKTAVYYAWFFYFCASQSLQNKQNTHYQGNRRKSGK